MNPPATGREALLIEALDGMIDVLDRVELLIPTLSEGERGLLAANHQLTAQLGTLDARMVRFAEAAKMHVVKHIAQYTDQATQRLIDEHVGAMEKAAHLLFIKDVGPALRSLVQPLQRAAEIAEEAANPWNSWLTHAATAMGASGVTWVLTSGVWRP